MPSKRCARKVRVQGIHDLVDPEHGAGIFQHDEKSNGANPVLRVTRGNQLLRTFNHDANVCRFLFCFQLWNIESECLRIIPVLKEMECKVIEMKRKRLLAQEQEWTRQSQTRESLDW